MKSGLLGLGLVVFLPTAAFAQINPLALIAQDESAGGILLQNPNSTASGDYQIINATWQSACAQVAGCSVAQYPTAISAPNSVQTAVTAYLYNTQGFGPWSSNQQLAADIVAAGGTSAFVEGFG